MDGLRGLLEDGWVGVEMHTVTDAYGDYGREGVTELARGGCQWGQRNGSGLFVQGVRV